MQYRNLYLFLPQFIKLNKFYQTLLALHSSRGRLPLEHSPIYPVFRTDDLPLYFMSFSYSATVNKEFRQFMIRGCYILYFPINKRKW